MLQRTYLGLAFGMIAPATIFAAQQAQFIQSLDESEHQSAASSAISSAVSSSITQAQVSVEALTEQQLNREYRLVLPNGESMMCPVRLLRHAGLFRSIIEANPEVVDIPVGQYIATLYTDKNNSMQISLEDLYNFLKYIESKDESSLLSMSFFWNEQRGTYSNRWMQVLLVASYFDISFLFNLEKDYVTMYLGEKKINEEALSQIPDDVQVQLFDDYAKNTWNIIDFFGAPKKVASHIGIVVKAVTSSDSNFITEIFYDISGQQWVRIKSARTKKVLLENPVVSSVIDCSPDGTHVVFGFPNGMLEIKKINYNIENDTVTLGTEFVSPVHQSSVNVVQYSPYGTHIASASSTDGVIIWDIVSEEKQSLPHTHTNGVKNIEYSPDGARIALVDDNGKLYIYDVSTCKQCAFCGSDLDPIDSIRWSEDGKQIIFTTDSCSVFLVIWDIGQEKYIEQEQYVRFYCNGFKHEGDILSLQLQSEGTEISASTSQCSRTWDVYRPEMFLLTINQIDLIEDIITEKSIPGKPVADSDDQSKKLYEIYESLSDRWKKILTDRFASTSAATSAVGAEASSSSAAASAAASTVT